MDEFRQGLSIEDLLLFSIERGHDPFGSKSFAVQPKDSGSGVIHAESVFPVRKYIGKYTNVLPARRSSGSTPIALRINPVLFFVRKIWYFFLQWQKFSCV